MHTVNFIENGPVQTAYFDEGEGEVLLLVHGFTGGKLDFQDQMLAFTHTYRVIAFDQRGHGESSNVAPYNFYTLVADLINLLDVLEIEQCHILGHSLGGMVVLRALIAHSERFKSAILIDTAASPPALIPKAIREKLNTVVTKNGCDALLENMQGQTQSASVQRGIDFLGEVEHWRRIRVKLEQMDPTAFVELGEVLADHPSITSNLKQIDQRTSVIVGAEDKPFIEPSRTMAKHLPNAELVVIPNAGHSPQYENAEAWQTAIETHLSSNR